MQNGRRVVLILMFLFWGNEMIRCDIRYIRRIVNEALCFLTTRDIYYVEMMERHQG